MKVDRTRNWVELHAPVFHENVDEGEPEAVDANIDGNHLHHPMQHDPLTAALGTHHRNDHISGNLEESNNVWAYPHEATEQIPDDYIFDGFNERQFAMGPGHHGVQSNGNSVTYDGSDRAYIAPGLDAESQPADAASVDELSWIRTPSSWYTRRSRRSPVSSLELEPSVLPDWLTFLDVPRQRESPEASDDAATLVEESTDD
ncbi:hypothetical protein CBER1_09229 [Cercospora berteroae]|uniref:Uncharacterized protein n=1 Tax=Cercospora berteroae TaxID=357750 RepID=A0A2S6BVH5_9PEZI|nr:hypothetical protein CBER1_09229 [Cercospora berteroae]